VRWAAIESVQILPRNTVVGAMRHRVGERRGRNIGAVAAARHNSASSTTRYVITTYARSRLVRHDRTG